MAVHINHPRFTKKDKRKLGLLMIVVGLGGAIGAMAVGRVCPSAQPQRMVRNQSTRPGKGRR